MNTWIWGPPKWKFLHTLSFSPLAPRYATEVGVFVNTLKFVLPCIFCRDSFTQFVGQVEREMEATMEQIVRKKQFAQLMYSLHDKVNAKLDVQSTHDRMKQEGLDTQGLTPSQDVALCRKRQITFECLSKRFTLRPVHVCPDDIWEFLLIFALNMDDTSHRASSEQREQWQTYFELMPLMVEIAAGISTHGKWQELVAVLNDYKQSTMDAVRDGVTSIFSTIVYQQCLFNHAKYSTETVNKVMETYSTARATTCTHGSCK